MPNTTHLGDSYSPWLHSARTFLWLRHLLPDNSLLTLAMTSLKELPSRVTHILCFPILHLPLTFNASSHREVFCISLCKRECNLVCSCLAECIRCHMCLGNVHMNSTTIISGSMVIFPTSAAEWCHQTHSPMRRPNWIPSSKSLFHACLFCETSSTRALSIKYVEDWPYPLSIHWEYASSVCKYRVWVSKVNILYFARSARGVNHLSMPIKWAS